MFEQAVRYKWRFQYRGMLSVEDLWDLNVEQLDEIFKNLNRQLNVTQEESLLEIESKQNETLKSKIAIVRYIVTIKLQEREAHQIVAEKAARKQKLLELLERKQDEALSDLDVDKLREMIAELEN